MLRLDQSFTLLTLALALGTASALGACGSSSTTTVAPLDGGGPATGSDGGGGTDAGSTVDGSTPVVSVCTSGTTWTNGNIGSPQMRPGDTCISCHKSSGGKSPQFLVAGTVYPTRHEPLNCNGLESVSVVITDANGTETTLTSNAVGNFACGPTPSSGFTVCNPVFPISARILTMDGKTATMTDPQMTGDCNSCHTETGNSNAPGRISPP